MIRGICGRGLTTVRKMITSAERNYATVQIAPLQRAALEERCILVDNFDRAIGESTKKACHEVDAEGNILLHRAFSVFLFNTKGELLLQKRSDNKITFPGHYTNTCCSHPLAEIPDEMVEDDAIGIRRAAIRRLGYELGIPSTKIQPAELFYLARIHYKAINPNDRHWGEHEIDYVLFLQKDLPIDPNPDEVSEVRWVSRSEIENFVKTVKSPLTPWFHLIFKYKLLLHWWDNMDTLDKMQDIDNIITL